ncbi:unnamed protein product [Caenorhabditis angaria]|uniref:Uncharacterized protein n=1 Tax=Caenorhabditis angaria TaxID=860376 RepID=A0A9P1IXP1_9PELO|nr:unnamed protein product [Caenorhabditis angaria]
MEVTNLSTGFADFGEISHSTDLLVAQGKLWLFNLNFKDQPNLHFGSHVVHIGSYVLVFDLSSKTWTKIEFPAITNEENLGEQIFTHNDQIYLILYKNFGGYLFDSLYKFNGSGFEKLEKFTHPAEVSFDSQIRISSVSANGSSSNGDVVLVLNGRGMAVFTLRISEDQGSNIEFIAEAHEEPSPMSGTATSAAVINNNAIISYGVHGCGFRWQSNVFTKIDLSTKSVQDIHFDSEDHPRFCFSGARTTSLNSANEWIHAAGSIQVGMTGSKFDGSVWKLTNILGDSPNWVQVQGELSGKIAVANGNEIWTVSPDNVNYYKF